MNLISINDLSKQQILSLFERAEHFRMSKQSAQVDTSKLAGLLFFEPSTRTRIGFETAAWEQGYKSILLSAAKPSVSEGWSESMDDTIRTMNAYVDMYFIRHSDSNIFGQVIPYTTNPVVNCGNGYDEHPTQALIDAYTIWFKFGRLDDLTITFIGDTKYSRAAHSLTLLLYQFNNIKIQEITPKTLSMPKKYAQNPPAHIGKTELGQENVLYSAGFPPINPSGTFSQEIVQQYIVRKEDADRLSSDCIIMNPLPRIDEIDKEVDSSPKAYYFKQNELGLYMRMAIVEAVTKK
jgi:aspartate carbamoyltransferase catalytic subunit